MKNKKKGQKIKTKNILKQLKDNKKLLIILIVILAIIVWGIYKLVVFIQNPTDTFSVEKGKIYQEERATGYIIREETIVKGSNYKNGMEQIKTEGERVAKGEPIFRYYTSGEENLVNKIKELDSKIEEALAKENTLLLGDIRTLEKQIETDINSLYYENNMQNISKIKKEISNNIVKKAKIAGELSPAGSYLKKLVDERSKYENQLNEGAEYLSSPISGVISYKVDGYEDVLNTQDFSKLNSKFLEGLNLKVGQVVADSKESAKIINNFECYIASVLDSKQAKDAKVGQTVKLRLPNEVEISSEIVYISNEDSKVVIVFEIDKQVQEMISYRKISFDIIWWSYSGKKVPNEAIAYEQKGENQVAYVIRTRVGYQDKIWIKVLRSNEKYTIVDNYESEELKELGYTDEEIRQRRTLTLYDEILKKPT
ncbi:MAG: HlyD family efflux transporter periplasmic adaptor subunit [Clostridia bacterium]